MTAAEVYVDPSALTRLYIHQAGSREMALWRAAINRASELSRRHTPTLGTRSLDVLHVACALELQLRHFLTFDERQRQLAAAVGLKLIRP